MHKRIITVAALLFMAIAPLRSQILIVSDDEFNNNRSTTDGFGVMVPQQDIHLDQYVPLGEAMLLLAGMGAAYLVAKRRKE